MADFVHFYIAGKVARSAQRSQLYSWDIQKHFLEKITPIPLPKEDFMTQYSPIVFLMMAPFSLLPIDYAHLLFDVIGGLVGLFGYFTLSLYLLDSKNKMAGWILLGALASVHSGMTWLTGQISWFYLGIACFYVAFMLKKQNILAALCLTLAFIKPQYALMLLIPAFCLRRFRLLFYTCGWGLLFFAICTGVFGFEAMINYPKVLNQVELSVHTQAMYCLRPILELFLPNKIAYVSSIFLLLLVFLYLLVTGLIQLKANWELKENSEFIRWLLAVVIVAAVLFSPHTHSHDLLLLIIPALLTLPFTERNRSSVDLTFWRIIFYILPIIGWGCYALVCLQLSANFIFTGIMAILFVCGLRQMLRHGCYER